MAAGVVADPNFGWELAFGALIYGVQAAVWHAIRIFAKLREKEVAAAESESLRVRSEMEALRGRLDPHFLFNGLHSITALVREDPLRAEEALLRFSSLLRRVLAAKADASDTVTLADEMAFVHDYLAIEHLRLGQRLRLSEEVSAEAKEQSLPSFSVQPLVENAIRHAVAPRHEGGTIAIRAAVDNGRLTVVVADDGPGADPSLVARAPGVGLNVIRQRLRLQYGARAGFAVETQPGKGFRAILSLPALDAESASAIP
jgi:LytS/YehU family sensor histidine kinase